MSAHNVSSATGASHGSVKSYIIGFILSIILTIVPYFIVVKHMLPVEVMAIVVFVLAIGQLFIQLVFFLHLNSSSEQRWNLITIMFTAVVLLILVIGTIWIMWNLNYNMMDHDMMSHSSM